MYNIVLSVYVFFTLLQPTLITKRGYPCETHTVVTEDGYILNMHRIPYGNKGETGQRIPVHVQHGLTCNSADWVISPEGQALGK